MRIPIVLFACCAALSAHATIHRVNNTGIAADFTTLQSAHDAASEDATLVLDQEQEEPMTFMLFNTVGKEVKRITVPAHTLRFPLSTAPLAPALYHYQVRGPSGMLGSGKLTIIR